MTHLQKGDLGTAHGNIVACQRILQERAAHGTKARPTVAELNEILSRLRVAQDSIECAVKTAEA